MPALISEQKTDCAPEPSNSELVVEQEEATKRQQSHEMFDSANIKVSART
jgi:hypothetical protein